jgi:SAM-dependent methyltransferase
MLPTRDQLDALFTQKYGPPHLAGPSPRRRREFGYYLPADVYEAVVQSAVSPGCTWLDAGGGRDVFPQNPALAATLVSRCRRMVAVDPSANVLDNRFAHERVQALIEDYVSPTPFDLATLRMVVEHITDPVKVVRALRPLLRPGGLVIILTVNAWSPITVVSRLTPFALHSPIKKMLWGNEERDTFPVAYRMNTRRRLRQLFESHGFSEQTFSYLDDLSAFGAFPFLSALELWTWSILKTMGARYPENCLLGMYRKST